eukprot:373024-Amphidinium_carterae.1
MAPGSKPPPRMIRVRMAQLLPRSDAATLLSPCLSLPVAGHTYFRSWRSWKLRTQSGHYYVVVPLSAEGAGALPQHSLHAIGEGLVSRPVLGNRAAGKSHGLARLAGAYGGTHYNRFRTIW